MHAYESVLLQVEMQHAEALKQDALVFDYDSHFDEMNAAKKGAAQKATVQREVHGHQNLFYKSVPFF